MSMNARVNDNEKKITREVEVLLIYLSSFSFSFFFVYIDMIVVVKTKTMYILYRSKTDAKHHTKCLGFERKGMKTKKQNNKIDRKRRETKKEKRKIN